MTTPFFLLIFAKFILKEKLNFISWIAIILGFCGVIIVLRPGISNLNIFIFLVILVAIYNAFNFTIVSKYSHIASSYGFTFYHYLPFTLFSYIFFITDPLIPSANELILFISSGILVIISMWSWTAAYHIAGKYSSIISPFFFTQIIWGSLYGKIFFLEYFDAIAVIGIIVIVISGTIAIYNRNK
jgi:drug/metabolite transporter (DMT)-like permease